MSTSRLYQAQTGHNVLPTKLRQKWKNTKYSAKTSVSRHKVAVRATGGGPPPTPPSPRTERVIQLISPSGKVGVFKIETFQHFCIVDTTTLLRTRLHRMTLLITGNISKYPCLLIPLNTYLLLIYCYFLCPMSGLQPTVTILI